MNYHMVRLELQSQRHIKLLLLSLTPVALQFGTLNIRLINIAFNYLLIHLTSFHKLN